MARWFWEGVFSVDVPPRWEVRDSPELIEIVPPEPGGAAHFSVYNQTQVRPPKPGEASAWVRRFAAERDQVVDPTETEATDGRVARASLTESTEGDPIHWEVGVYMWPERAVLFTYAHDNARPEVRDAAVAIFDSLVPMRLDMS